MLRIRFHGRGGQGIKTASRILGTALFKEGYVVQDAPRYGAERRGAPIFAYVRANGEAIYERGIITNPDLVIIADPTLLGITAAGVLNGTDAHTAVLIATSDDIGDWAERLKSDAQLIRLPLPESPGSSTHAHIGAICAGGAARLLGQVSAENLKAAIEEELCDRPPDQVNASVKCAQEAFDLLQESVCGELEAPKESISTLRSPDWVDLPIEPAAIAAPAIFQAANSVQIRTGLWRTVRPVLDKDECNKCTWVCGSFCPDGVISVDEDGFPHVDLDQCKGCMICVVQCPKHALVPVAETEAIKKTTRGSA